MPQTEYWKEYWGVSGNPFDEEPVHYTNPNMRNLLVQTSAIKKIDRLIEDTVRSSGPRRVYVIGARGMGKSTVLNYLVRGLFLSIGESRILPIYINRVSEAQDPSTLKQNFVTAAIRKTFETVLHDLSKFNYNDESLIRFVRERRTKFYNEIDKITPAFAEDLLYEYLELFSSKFGLKGTVFVYDELDKIDNSQQVVVPFLRKSQAFFENISRKGSYVYIAGIPDWINLLKSEEYSGISGESVDLNPWSADDAFNLITSRLRDSIFPPRDPFTKDALELITAQAQGRPRQILTIAKTFLSVAAVENAKKIDAKFCERVVWSPMSIAEFFSKVSPNEDLFRAGTKLRNAYDPVRDDPRIFRVILILRKVDQLRADEASTRLRKEFGLDVSRAELTDILSVLEHWKVIRIRRSGGMLYELHADVKGLLQVVEGLGVTIEFLPYALRLRESEVESLAPLDVNPLVLRCLRSRAKKWTPEELAQEILTDSTIRERAIAFYAAGAGGIDDEFIFKRLVKDIRTVLRKEVQRGFVREVSEETKLKYGWYPKYLRSEEFDGLPVDQTVIQDLEAAEREFKEGAYMPACSICRNVLEYSMRRLYEAAKIQSIPGNWTNETLREELRKADIIDEAVKVKILTLQNSTNPIVHKDVAEVDEAWAKTILDLTVNVTKNLHQRMKSFEVTKPKEDAR